MGTCLRLSLYRTVRFSPFLLPMFSPFPHDVSKRYPGDIPDGTAVPRWAFYDVTVRNLRCPGRLHTNVLRSCRSMDHTPTPLPKLSGVSRTSTPEPFGILTILLDCIGDPEELPKQVVTTSQRPDPTATGSIGTPSKHNNTGAIIGGQSRLLFSFCILSV